MVYCELPSGWVRRKCEFCGSKFRAQRSSARYCDRSCRQQAYKRRQLAAEWQRLDVPIEWLRQIEREYRYRDYSAGGMIAVAAIHHEEGTCIEGSLCAVCLMLNYPPASVLDELGPAWYATWCTNWQVIRQLQETQPGGKRNG